MSGTSFAAPHAAGAMALLLSAFPNTAITDLEAALTQGATDLGPAGPDNSYGAGALNALAAYNILAASAGSPPIITSTPLTSATQGVAYTYTVTATDPAGSALSFSLTTAPTGMLIDAASGVISWTPTGAQAGANAVTVRVVNALGLAATQSFTITVNPNLPPTAGNDAYSILQDSTLSVAMPGVLTNDSDPEGKSVTAVLAAGATRGTLTLNADGSLTYRPNAGVTGIDSFSYRAFDGVQYSSAATVTLTVLANHAPVANNDSANAPVRGSASYPPVVINVVANDSDADGNLNVASVAITTAPNKGGSVTVNANGTVSYTPKSGYRGTETFRYKVRDTLSLQSNAATVTVSVK